jgi:TonB family protein
MQAQTVSVYFAQPAASVQPKTHTTAPRLLTKPAEVNAEKPVQPAIETPSPPSPSALEESAVVPPQSNLPTPQKIERISSLTRVPGPLKKIEAAYPAAERRAGMQAYVLAEVIIDAHGTVQDVHILKSGGNAFDTAVIEALKKSAFTPGYIGDNAVSVRIAIPFRFNLN